ncbi:hypothetical protein Q1695_005653 [Nippostrongylus brasiliensis]|nr:hypothetical protein Q1695_005653 [Nippostrongylus brasiliensis]
MTTYNKNFARFCRWAVHLLDGGKSRHGFLAVMLMISPAFTTQSSSDFIVNLTDDNPPAAVKWAAWSCDVVNGILTYVDDRRLWQQLHAAGIFPVPESAILLQSSITPSIVFEYFRYTPKLSVHL